MGVLSPFAPPTRWVATAADELLTAPRRVAGFYGRSCFDWMNRHARQDQVLMAWLLVWFRRIRTALLTMLPVVTAVGPSTLVVAGLGLQVSMLAALSSALVIAVCTEFSVLVLTRYEEERRAGRTPDAAIATASMRIGRAFVTSGLTTAGGFAVLAFSGFPLLSSFGAIVAINVVVSMICALVILPPLLRWERRRGQDGFGQTGDVDVEVGAPPQKTDRPAA